MARILITGANRGIGLELARQYAERGDDVIACVRDPSGAEALQELAAGGKVTVEQMDVGDPGSITAARERIGDVAIDVLINNAGAAT